MIKNSIDMDGLSVEYLINDLFRMLRGLSWCCSGPDHVCKRHTFQWLQFSDK